MKPDQMIEFRTKRYLDMKRAAMLCHVHYNSWRAWEQEVRPIPPYLELIFDGVRLRELGRSDSPDVAP